MRSPRSRSARHGWRGSENSRPDRAGPPQRPRSGDRGADQVAEQFAKVGAVFRALDHDDREQRIARADPERGAHHAAPEELADAARGRRFAGIVAHRKAEAEAVAGPEQKVIL